MYVYMGTFIFKSHYLVNFQIYVIKNKIFRNKKQLPETFVFYAFFRWEIYLTVQIHLRYNYDTVQKKSTDNGTQIN